MRAHTLAFVAGVCVLQRLPQLPPLWPLLGLALLFLVLSCLPLRGWRPLSSGGRLLCGLLAAFFIGLGFADVRAGWRLADRLAPVLEGETLLLTGTVASLITETRYGPRFRFQVETPPPGVPTRLLLDDRRRVPANTQADDPAHDPTNALPAWQPGQRWRLPLRLKRPHGNQNPGGMDYEAWLLAEGIGATGHVAKGERTLLQAWVTTPGAWIDRTRAALAERIARQLPGRDYAGIVVALVVGDASGITPAQWALFRNTGITHLVSISGLHVTLVAGLFGTVAGWAWRRSARLTAYLPAPTVAVLAGLLAACLYALLAGFAVPTRRTFFMVGAAALALLSGRRLAASTIWVFALGCTVLFDPWAVLSMGFWLSFLTVGAMLLALAPQWRLRTGWRDTLAQWGGAQWAATLGSLPLLILLFQQMPLVSPLANAVAIPLVSLGVTPLALLGSVEPSGLALRMGHGLLVLTFDLLAPLADPRWVWQQARPPLWTLPWALLAVGVLLLPRGLPGRWLALPALLPLLWPWQPQRPEGAFSATVLDVGQGLAVLVQTRQHTLLFDAGPEGQGGRAVPAALRALGVNRLDKLVLSHDDPAHTGGAMAVLSAVPTLQRLGAAPLAPFGFVPLQAQPPHAVCRAGMRWVWDGVVFTLLNPPEDWRLDVSENDRSCVLKVSGPGGSLLIPADISPVGEAALLVADAAALRADALILPNHGAKGSSTPGWVSAVAPRVLVATVGYRNAYRHPRAEVLARYEAQGAAVWRSDRDGAVQLKFAAQAGQPPQVQAWRTLQPRYWHAAAREETRMAAETKTSGAQ